MRVAMIGQKGLPATFGGVEKHCEELGARLVSLGCDVTVFCRPYYSAKKIAEMKLEKINSRHYIYKGMTLEMRPTIPTKHMDAAAHTLLCSILSAFRKYDVVHYHALGPTFFSPMVQLFGKKTVATVHGLDWRRGKWGAFAKKFLRMGEKVAATRPDALIVVSRTLRDYFKKQYHQDVHYIPNGINPPQRAAARDIQVRWHLEKGSYILFVGRLVPEKGCHTLISAFRKTETDKSLVIAGGDSHSEEYIKKLHKLAEGDGRILFTGFVYGNTLDELYSNAYFYTHPSDLEGLPLSLLEALSYGNCVLASDIPENAEVISPEGREENGFLFKTGDVDSLAQKMRYLLDHPMIVMEKAGDVQDYVMNSYNWDRIAEETLGVYRKACGRSDA